MVVAIYVQDMFVNNHIYLFLKLSEIKEFSLKTVRRIILPEKFKGKIEYTSIICICSLIVTYSMSTHIGRSIFVIQPIHIIKLQKN